MGSPPGLRCERAARRPPCWAAWEGGYTVDGGCAAPLCADSASLTATSTGLTWRMRGAGPDWRRPAGRPAVGSGVRPDGRLWGQVIQSRQLRGTVGHGRAKAPDGFRPSTGCRAVRPGWPPVTWPRQLLCGFASACFAQRAASQAAESCRAIARRAKSTSRSAPVPG